MMRTCKYCCIEKELKEFVPSKQCLLGITYKCKKCKSDYDASYNKKIKEVKETENIFFNDEQLKLAQEYVTLALYGK